MSEPNIKIKTKNVFGLDPNFMLQTAKVTSTQTMPVAVGNTGAAVASAGLEAQTNYTQDANYCGAALRTDFGAIAAGFGQVATGSEELITNGDFSDGTTGWTLVVSGGAAADPIIVVSGALKTIPTISGARFDIRPETTTGLFPLVAGTAYTLTFDAWADAAKDCSAFIYDTPNINQTVSLTETSQTFSIEFTASVSAASAFLLAGGDTLIPWYLDNVSIRESGLGLYSPVVSDLSITYSAMAYPSIAVSGHNHPSIPHTSMSVTADISDIIPDSGFGVPSFGISLGNSSPISAGLTANIEHFDVNDVDGTHIHGENTEKVLCNLSMGFSGIPESTSEADLETDLKAYFSGEGITIDRLNVTSTDENSTNTAFDSFALAATFYV